MHRLRYLHRFLLLGLLIALLNSCLFSKADIDSWLEARERERTYRFCHVEYSLNGEFFSIDGFGTSPGGGWLKAPRYEAIFNNYFPNDSLERVKFRFHCDTEEGLFMRMEVDLRNESQFQNKKRYKQVSATTPLIINPPEGRTTGWINYVSISNYYYSFQLIEDGQDAFMFLFDLDYIDCDTGDLMEIRDGKVILSDKFAHFTDYEHFISEDND